MNLGELEKRVMAVFWNSGESRPLSVREALERVNTTQRSSYAYNTILTVITHLFEKKLLKRRSSGKAFVYFPTCSKNDFIARTSSSLFSQMEKEYGALAVAHFVRYMDTVDPKILEEARKLIDAER